MSDTKYTCPWCGSHTTAIGDAFAEGEPCPECGAPVSREPAPPQWIERPPSDRIKATTPFRDAINLDKAVEIIGRIQKLRDVQRELKSAFARSELDGGAKAALQHPLYLAAQAKLDQLHDDLMVLI